MEEVENGDIVVGGEIAGVKGEEQDGDEVDVYQKY